MAPTIKPSAPNPNPNLYPQQPKKAKRKGFIQNTQDFLTPPKPQSIPGEPKLVYGISPAEKGVWKKFTALFSAKTFKTIAKYGSVFAGGAALTAVITAFAGPAIQGGLVAMAASSVFPPVMIAIAATLGVSLLFFGLYKLVQHGRNKLKEQEALEKAQQGQADNEESVPSYPSSPMPTPPPSIKAKKYKNDVSGNSVIPPQPQGVNDDTNAWQQTTSKAQ